jgi:alpha-aminoadipate/glutamate carrier protein LysW
LRSLFGSGYNPDSARDPNDIAELVERNDPAGAATAGCGTLRGGGMATCPECDADIEIDEFDVDKGDFISCPECGTGLEVINLSPIELDLAPEEEEDEEEDELDEDSEDEEEDWEE